MFANVESIKKSLEKAEKTRREGETENARIAEKRALAKTKEIQIESCMFQ